MIASLTLFRKKPEETIFKNAEAQQNDFSHSTKPFKNQVAHKETRKRSSLIYTIDWEEKKKFNCGTQEMTRNEQWEPWAE